MAEAINSGAAIGADKTDTKTQPKLLGMLIKDTALVLAALSLWAAADTWHQVTGLWLAQVIAVGDAILVGLVLAGLFHEWGHYAGAAAAEAKTTRVYPKGLTLFRFKFEFAHNDARQFHWMTYGGHVLHWGVWLLLVVSLPLDSLSRIALVSSVFGFIIFASIIEYGIVKDTWRGADPETRLQALNSKDFQQATLIGTLGGLFMMAALS